MRKKTAGRSREEGQRGLGEFGETPSGARKNKFPIQGTCHSCSRQRWLTWLVDERYVCDECKKHLSG
ncbi:MAG: hypothetical protein PHG85_04265 [Candidatus Altiarchaeota archaeon]|nr:hypothetical protein [Candidatus Altiarchaeota archaeon]